MTRIVLLSMLLGLACGCAAHFPPNDPKLQVAQAEFDVPPKQMVQNIRQVLSSPPISIRVDQAQRGSILTGWQRFPGEWHVVRQWQERTRYRITVSPDFDQPLNRCSVQVRDFTEQRAAEGMKWESNEALPRPQRSIDLLDQIKKSVATSAPATTQLSHASR